MSTTAFSFLRDLKETWSKRLGQRREDGCVRLFALAPFFFHLGPLHPACHPHPPLPENVLFSTASLFFFRLLFFYPSSPRISLILLTLSLNQPVRQSVTLTHSVNNNFSCQWADVTAQAKRCIDRLSNTAIFLTTSDHFLTICTVKPEAKCETVLLVNIYFAVTSSMSFPDTFLPLRD